MSERPDKKNKKKGAKGRPQTRVAEASGRPLYVDLLGTLQPSLDPLAEKLSERDERRSLHLFHLLTLLRPFFDGLSQLYEALLWLARLPGVDGDVAYLLQEAAEQVLSGTESLLAEPAPRVLDEARHLMEIEFLFFEFTRTPDRLQVWKAVSEGERIKEFGFDALRRREEEAQGIPAEKVLFDQEEYRMHSSAVHPQPLSRRSSISPPTRRQASSTTPETCSIMRCACGPPDWRQPSRQGQSRRMLATRSCRRWMLSTRRCR